ncbi:hypothetical protein EMMF5_003058 [Cystobasidiomycetes sp. EMM_F5]
MLSLLISLVCFVPLALVVGTPLRRQSTPSNGTSGCGKIPPFQRYSNRSISLTTSSGVNRTYTIYVPSTYNSSKPTPLVITYHGRNGSSDVQYALTQFGNEAYNPYAISVYPQGLLGVGNQSAWQGASYASPLSNDTQFTNDLLDSLRSMYCIDDSRIYASGKSNGGGFVDTLACSTVGARFAAFSSCSGAFYTDNALSQCPNVQTVTPYLEFHGSIDDTVPYDGKNNSAGGNEPPIPLWLSWWGQRNGCNATAGSKAFPSGYGGAGNVNITTYSCGTNNTQNIVQGYWIKGMGHSWPSTSNNTDNIAHGDGPTVLNATPLIMQFYNAHVLSMRKR